MFSNSEELCSPQETEILVERGLRQLKQNINSLDPLILDKLERYLASRYEKGVTIKDEKSNVRVEVVVQYVDIKEVAINMAPFVKPISISEPSLSFQEGRLNLNRIDISEPEQLRCSMHVWQQLEYKDKIAFCLREIAKMKKDDLAILVGADKLAEEGKIDQGSAQMFKRNAAERLETIRRVEESIRTGKVEMSINAGDASILVKAK